MIEFFTVLFFGKTILLTPNEIDVDVPNGVYEVPLIDPLIAISDGASIQIDVTKMLKFEENDSVRQLRDVTSKRFKDTIIAANLMGKSDTILLTFKGGTSIDKNSVRIILEAENMPLDVEFDQLILETSIPLQQVRVFWKNHSK